LLAVTFKSFWGLPRLGFRGSGSLAEGGLFLFTTLMQNGPFPGPQGLTENYFRHDAVIRVYDESGNVIESHEHAGDFKEW
jgi:hypothetical protein